MKAQSFLIERYNIRELDLENSRGNDENNQRDMEADVFLAKDDTSAASFGSPLRDKLCRTSSWKSSTIGIKNSYMKPPGSTGTDFQNGLKPSFSQLPFIHHLSRTRSFVYAFVPPDPSSLTNSFSAHGLPNKEYKDPFYSNSQDLPKRPREYAGQMFDLTRGVGMASLPPWNANPVDGVTKQESIKPFCGWEYAGWPPSKRSVKLWLQELQSSGKSTSYPAVRLLVILDAYIYRNIKN